MKDEMVTIEFTKEEVKTILTALKDEVFNMKQYYSAKEFKVKSIEFVSLVKKININLLPKLNLKLNPNFEKYQPTEEDREEEIREMKESIIGMEGDR